MALTPIAVTEIIPTTWILNDILVAMHTHFTTVSTAFTIDLVSGSGAGLGFSVQSVADPGFQMVFRRTSATSMKTSIEPTASITDCGDLTTAPTGGGADWSGETYGVFTIGSVGAGSKVWLVEMADAFFVMMKSTDGLKWLPCIHIGRVYVPDFPSIDVPRGRDGLGTFVGQPTFYSTTNTWGYYVSGSLIHMATGIWTHPSTEINMTSPDTYMNSVVYAGFLRPGLITLRAYRSAGSSIVMYQHFGFLKYCVRTPESYDALTRIDFDNTTDLAFIQGGYSPAAVAGYCLAIPWLKAVTP
jgi:hypothetical protein